MTNEKHPLYSVSLKVLEDWGMMLVDGTENSTQIFNLDEPLFMSHVKMSGAFEGTISIVAQKEFIHTLATNLLGGEQTCETLEAESIDAFREMGNVLAGNYLTEAYGTDVAFDVLTPTVSEISAQKLEELAHPTLAYFFIADDAPVCITFDIKK